MNDESQNSFYQNFFAVLAGVLSAIVTGFIIKMAFEKLLHSDLLDGFSLSENKSSFNMHLAIAAWLFISSIVGGIVCARIAGKNDMSHIIIGSLVVLAMYFLVGGTAIFNAQSLASWALLLVIPIGYSIGEWMGGRKSSTQ